MSEVGKSIIEHVDAGCKVVLNYDSILSKKDLLNVFLSSFPNSKIMNGDVYFKNTRRDVKTLLIGLYSYQNDYSFCDFETTDYISRKLNSSSAHVYTIDLAIHQ